MEKDNLIEKLEKVSVPEIESRIHKEKLKAVLLKKFARKMATEERPAFFFFKKTALIGATIAVFVVASLGFNLAFTSHSLAKAEKMFKEDPQIKELLKKGNEIKEIKIVKNKAFALLSPIEETVKNEISLRAQKSSETKKEPIAVLAEINLSDKKMIKIEEITTVANFLSENDREKAKEIIAKEAKSGKSLPLGVKVIKTEPISPELKLIKKGNSMEVKSEIGGDKKAIMILKEDGKEWLGKVNLSQEKLEKLESLPAPSETEN